jgi:hypothetical protein
MTNFLLVIHFRTVGGSEVEHIHVGSVQNRQCALRAGVVTTMYGPPACMGLR